MIVILVFNKINNINSDNIIYSYLCYMDKVNFYYINFL